MTVSCIGMLSVELDPQPVMTIRLKTDHQQLDEVLVVAFGQQTKSSFTGSAAVVKSETLEKKQLTNVISGLQGQVAGLVISPFRVPFTITEAPMTGSPFSSMTVPFMSMLWADENCSAAKNINKNTKIFRFIR